MLIICFPEIKVQYTLRAEDSCVSFEQRFHRKGLPYGNLWKVHVDIYPRHWPSIDDMLLQDI
jgi:hypothetical protein